MPSEPKLREMTGSARHPGDGRLPPGALAWRQYEVKLLSGRTATVAFSLGDPRDVTIARVKRERDACNLGLLVVLNDPDSAEEVVLWFQRATSLTLLSHGCDAMIGEELTTLLPRYFTAFFDEVKDIAPELGDVVFTRVPRMKDRNLH
jgi:hypothetical protein